ncbi:MAG: sigma-70 family RNA polymerase sigma factor [Candidatus Bathyarchaeota archaeon]|nr:MAG: sigma-70 family RNA polymerase sigma factor [Candidatus Bathyarchaeota archaeon]
MREEDFTDLGGVRKSFLTTQWSLIEKVRSHEQQDKNQALIGQLIKRYWKPVYCYVRRKGYKNEEAKDIVQSFFHEVVLGRELIQKADKGKGQFRSFLLFALNRYLKVVQRDEKAKKRIPKSKLLSGDTVDISQLMEITSGLTPEESFDYAWVSDLLQEVLKEVEAQCYTDGKMVHWNIFEDRVLKPIMEDMEAPSMEEICHKYGISDTIKASNMIVTVKRRFRLALKEHVRESVTSDGQIEEELEEIMQFIPKIAQYG